MKKRIIKNILNGYEKILKFNSEVDTIRLNNIDELTYNDMTTEFNDLLKINYKNVDKFIKKKKITILSNTPSNNSDDNNNNNNKILIDIISLLTKNNTLLNIPNNTLNNVNEVIKNDKYNNDILSTITKNNTIINTPVQYDNNNNSLYETYNDINNNKELDVKKSVEDIIIENNI